MAIKAFFSAALLSLSSFEGRTVDQYKYLSRWNGGTYSNSLFLVLVHYSSAFYPEHSCIVQGAKRKSREETQTYVTLGGFFFFSTSTFFFGTGGAFIMIWPNDPICECV
jgi:hypothetical protein